MMPIPSRYSLYVPTSNFKLFIGCSGVELLFCGIRHLLVAHTLSFSTTSRKALCPYWKQLLAFLL